MSNSIQNRIIVLADAIQRRKMEQVAPVDPLSASLFASGQELVTLDAGGKVELLDALNSSSGDGTMGLDLDMENLERWIKAFCGG